MKLVCSQIFIFYLCYDAEKKPIAHVVCNDNKICIDQWNGYRERVWREMKKKRVSSNTTMKKNISVSLKIRRFACH